MSREQVPHLPAPPMQAVSAVASATPEDLPSTNLYDRFKNTTPLLNAQQVDAYLKANGRKASSLLAAYRTSGDTSLLREAMEKYPNDPQVAFEAVASKDLSGQEKRQWLNTFEQTAPDNALANYLSAFDYFNSGQSDQAVQELARAAGKKFDDYTLDRIWDDDEAYLSAGYSTAEAGTAASRSLLMTQLLPLKQLGQRMIDLANSYNQAGDQTSAQASLQMAMKLGQTLESASSSSPALITQLVGVAVERMALGAMDPNSPYGGNGQTVQDQLNQIAQNKAAVNALDQQAEPLMRNLTDQDWVVFTNRRMLFGEVAAMQWVVGKYGHP
jgi:hypothetical protein